MTNRSQRADWTGRVLVCLAAVAVAVAAFLIARTTHPPVMNHQSAIELGPHEFGATAVARLVLSNSGSGELIVSRFQTSCSCAGVEVEHDGKFQRVDQLRIPARSQAEVVVRIGVGAKPGTSQQVHVTFTSNDPARPESAFDVSIPRVLGGVYPVPAAAIFGDIPQGSTETRAVYIYDNGVKSRRIGGVQVSHPERFEVELKPPLAGVHEPQVHDTAGNLIAVAMVRPKPGWTGPLDGHFELIVDGENRSADRVDVIGHILGPYTCVPDVLLLPRFAHGKEEYRGEFHVIRRDGKALASVVAVDAIKDVKTTIVPDPTDSARVKVVISCDAVAQGSVKTVQVRLRVQAGDEAATTIEVPVTVSGKSS